MNSRVTVSIKEEENVRPKGLELTSDLPLALPEVMGLPGEFRETLTNSSCRTRNSRFSPRARPVVAQFLCISLHTMRQPGNAKWAVPTRETTHLRWWRVKDSNLGRRKPADLQSAPIGRSGNPP